MFDFEKRKYDEVTKRWEKYLEERFKKKLSFIINNISQTKHFEAIGFIENYIFNLLTADELKEKLKSVGYELVINVNEPKKEYDFSEEMKAKVSVTFSDDDITVELKKTLMKL